MDDCGITDAEAECLMSKTEDGNEWELYKENVKPLKGGRNINILNEALKAHRDTSLKQSLLHQRRKMIEAIDEYRGDDPLNPWLECIKWVRESFPSGGDQSGLLSIYEQCVRTFWKDKRYYDDLRYLKIWLEYADQCADPEVVYSFLHANDIGQDHALFYIRYATCLELKNKMKKAEEVYRLGIARMARPMEKLENAEKNFTARVISVCKPKEDDSNTFNHENGPSRSFGTVMGSTAARQPPQSYQGIRKKLKPLTARNENQQLAIYNDSNIELDSRTSSSCGCPIEINNGCSPPWHILGTRVERNKENISNPTKWTANKITQRTSRTIKTITAPSLEVYVDEDCISENSTADCGPKRPIKALRDGDLQAVKREAELLKENPLFYFPRNSLPSESVRRHPQNPMLGHCEIINGKAGKYVWMTYQEAYDMCIQIGSAIRSCGVGPGNRCGIYGANCPEWIISMEACNSHGIYCVPLYDTLGVDAIEFIIGHAEISIAFVQEAKFPTILKCLPKCVGHLKTLISFASITEGQRDAAESVGVKVYSWHEFLSLGRKTNCKISPPKKTDICTIMYTSGTTGEPKGVLITNESIIAQVSTIDYLLLKTDKVVEESDTYFSFLPLAHIFDRTIEEYCIYKNASIGFWHGDVKFLVEDIAELKPTIFCGVPRVFDRIYTGINQKLLDGGALKKILFDFAYSYKLANMQKGLKQDKAAPFFDKLVFNKVKQGLGGCVRIIISGAAPLARHVEEFFRVTSCCVVMQGYGLTETCAGACTSIANVFSMIGTVGAPITSVEVRLESVPEMGYDALSETPRGEICIKGKTLFSGYHKREDLTNEVVIDGWFHTGDIGEWQPNGALKIIDRKKNIFKLSQGEYVAVENLESIFSHCSVIASIWIYGNSFESFLVAIVVPNQQVLESWATANEEAGNFESLCQNPKAQRYILNELIAIGKANNLKGFELPKAVHLDPRPFDLERDLITPTFKLKRPQLFKYYKDVIENLYKSVK